MIKISRSAKISNDRQERFSLSRIWDLNKPKILFIMLNPSYADDEFDDPTIRRLIFFSKKFKYGGFYVANLFTQITPYPKFLNIESSIQKNNLKVIKDLVLKSKTIVYAWGNLVNEPREFLSIVNNPLCFKKNLNGTPRHPLYLPTSSELESFRD